MGRVIGVILSLYVGYQMFFNSNMYKEITIVNNYDIVSGVYDQTYKEGNRSNRKTLYYSYIYNQKTYNTNTNENGQSVTKEIFNNFSNSKFVKVYVHKDYPGYSLLEHPQHDYFRQFFNIIFILIVMIVIVGIGFLIPI